jgi:hypothetical protein
MCAAIWSLVEEVKMETYYETLIYLYERLNSLNSHRVGHITKIFPDDWSKKRVILIALRDLMDAMWEVITPMMNSLQKQVEPRTEMTELKKLNALLGRTRYRFTSIDLGEYKEKSPGNRKLIKASEVSGADLAKRIDEFQAVLDQIEKRYDILAKKGYKF